MTETGCRRPIGYDALVAYWLGELPETEEAALEEHVFGCARCAGRLEELAALAAGLRAAVRSGALGAVITPRFLDAMKAHGLRIREYRLEPGDRVACTIRLDDDAVVGRMQAPLAGVTRVDMIEDADLGDGRVVRRRLEDVPFDPQAGELLALPSAAMLRAMPAYTLHVRLLAVGPAGERPLGEYTFAHAPG